jgi:hypothetical protein
VLGLETMEEFDALAEAQSTEQMVRDTVARVSSDLRPSTFGVGCGVRRAGLRRI